MNSTTGSLSQAEDDAFKARLLAKNCLLYENDPAPALLNVGTRLKPLKIPRSEAWQLSYSMHVLRDLDGDHARLSAARQVCAERQNEASSALCTSLAPKTLRSRPLVQVTGVMIRALRSRERTCYVPMGGLSPGSSGHSEQRNIAAHLRTSSWPPALRAGTAGVHAPSLKGSCRPSVGSGVLTTGAAPRCCPRSCRNDRCAAHSGRACSTRRCRRWR
jgi:hypothetical protein